jgi:hypothetical protein
MASEEDAAMNPAADPVAMDTAADAATTDQAVNAVAPMDTAADVATTDQAANAEDPSESSAGPDDLPPIELPPPVDLKSLSLDRLGVLLLQLHKVYICWCKSCACSVLCLCAQLCISGCFCEWLI